MKNKIAQLSKVFKLFSNEVRLCILLNLQLNGEQKVGDLQHCTDSSQSFVSQQLAKLKALDIITSRKVGNEVYYSIKNKEVGEILNGLQTKKCCSKEEN